MTETPVVNDHQRARSASPSQNSEADDIFSAVISEVDQTSLAPLAKSIRSRIDRQYNGKEPIVAEAIFGSYHMLFPLHFSDGVSWIVKIPHNGTKEKWDDLSANALLSEANTMCLLRRLTTIPLPEVFHLSSTTDNRLRCPYIMMSFVAGKSLYDVWFGHRLGNAKPEDVMKHRLKALSGIAEAMVQLGIFSFNQGGSMTFDAFGKFSGIGPARSLDHKAMLDRWFVHNDPSDDPIYVEDDVANGTKSYYLRPLARHPEEKGFPHGVWVLLHWLVNEIEEPENSKPFVLAHPNFDIQNFIVAEDGQLLSIIDWDGVAAVPRSVGNLRYPSWLTRDWDPAMYAYSESMDAGVEPEGVWEDSPNVLADYRLLYRQIMSRILGGTYDQRETRMSLITENLAIACHDPRCRNDILTKMIQQMGEHHSSPRFPSFTRLADKLGTNEHLLQKIRPGLEDAFRNLLLVDNL
ncbi:hypothetical protein F4821DRAFT_222486 [Hypoxylon rubiginosum]|uniref:Uncharacterized protein n=1 Tax=Hypoxylon rubiginosum TaxID=110542 RepID=A0ACC0DKD3_9PEZI|nr:hypothetical protein F4821DRAFT_222486 [Hypoxylon rubiginosum]